MPPRKKAEQPKAEAQDKATAYAKRVWNGQSPDVPRKERVARINAALAGQGFTADEIEAVKLPE